MAVVDVHYEDNTAFAACAVAQHWSDQKPTETQVAVISPIQAYRPGSFYERELPCIADVLRQVTSGFSAVVIDGYVDLSQDGAPGLGAHVHDLLGGNKTVIGVAKSPFHGSAFAVEVLRGESRRPLFVTARGIDLDVAADLVRSLHGEHRIPTLLQLVDRTARDAAMKQREPNKT